VPSRYSPEEIEYWRSKTPAERLAAGMYLTDLAWNFLRSLPPELEQKWLDAGREPWDPPKPPPSPAEEPPV
jgi:hypothetical protein